MQYERGAYDSAGRANSRWCVMVLAHNEERRIEACLNSILGAESAATAEIYVMANGCSDGTEEVVRNYRISHPSVHLVSIQLGDKCNAWNVFIHETVPRLCPDRELYFFMDGDARMVPGSLSVLEDGLLENLLAHAASAPPASGRSMEVDRRQLLHGRHLVANLYALRGEFVRGLQEKHVRLPLGLEGDDGLLGMLIKWDLKPETGMVNDMLIQPCSNAGFAFESVKWTDPREFRGYWRRLVRYGRRRFEFQLLGPRLRNMGLAGLPQHISEIYTDARGLRLRWEGFQTIPNWFALRQMRRVGDLAALQKRPLNAS